MKKLDWYILRQYITTFVFAILLLTFITVVIDTSEHSDDFVKSGLTTWEIIKQYHFGFIPRMITLLFPLFIFISVIFFTSKLAGRTEIIAILASGISFNRFLRPYWVGSIFFAVVLWLSFRYVTPISNQIFSAFQNKYINEPIFNNEYGEGTIYFRNDSTHYGQVSYFDTATKRGNSFVLMEIKNNQLRNNMRAESLVWDTAKRRWKLENVVIRTIDSTVETIRQLADTTIKLNFKPTEFKKGQYTKDVLKTPELVELIRKEQMRGAENINDLIVERHRRDATPISIILLTMMGVAVSSRKARGGSGFHLAMGIILAALFILTDRFSTIFSTKGSFPPMLAAWTPNIIFFFVTLYLFKKTPK
ncbi:MAG TPA: LptF/LptG family permease [Phnomibacter sp.]|nr:LptF/LptG family permease [Phnomibacter sp.]